MNDEERTDGMKKAAVAKGFLLSAFDAGQRYCSGLKEQKRLKKGQATVEK